MTEPITISKQSLGDSALNYDFLREEGIKLIQQLGGSNWTDHNVHDPGITILEQLCYAITDLAYRLDYNITDFLGDQQSAYQGLFSPARILTSSPITLLDLRKMVIDIKGVKNAWIEKVTQKQPIDGSGNDTYVVTPKGLYQVTVEKDDLVEARNLLDTIKKELQQFRGLCEDFEEVKILDKQYIRFEGTVDFSENAVDINQQVADLLHRLKLHLSPNITFYTLNELIDKGKRMDEIFDGPILKYGFIDHTELARNTRRVEVHASDVIKEMMDIQHVITVQNLLIASGSNSVKNWVFPLDSSKTPTLDIVATLDHLNFTVGGLKTNVNKDRVLALYNQQVISAVSTRESRLGEEKDIPLALGENRDIENYYSVQNQFPASYGIGLDGLPESVPAKRKAQAKQLTAYLTIFDQLLANYFSRAANFHQLMSFDSNPKMSHFKQSLLGTVNGLEEILQNKEDYMRYVQGEIEDTDLHHRNKFLNHLLARFSEKFNTYEIMLQNVEDDSIEGQKRIIADKCHFLKNYPEFSANRGKGYNYTQLYQQNENVSGLEKRIAGKLGIEHVEDGENPESFHMIEHILLRPRQNEAITLDNYYYPGEILGFEETEAPDFTRCMTTGHNLQAGETIQIQGNQTYQGIYTVQAVSDTSFEILASPQAEANTAASWKRVQPDLRYQVFSEPVTSFSASTETGRTFCKVANQLAESDLVKIVGTSAYDGTYSIKEVTADGFEIEAPFEGESTSGRCLLVNPPNDPYSLQLTFVFPSGVKRYQNPMFKEFVENTVREETPVHLQVYTKWLDPEELVAFKNALDRFSLETKKRFMSN